jgi:hypothetical protein
MGTTAPSCPSRVIRNDGAQGNGSGTSRVVASRPAGPTLALQIPTQEAT